MSYSFGMFFKQVNNADEAMEIMNKVAVTIPVQVFPPSTSPLMW